MSFNYDFNSKFGSLYAPSRYIQPPMENVMPTYNKTGSGWLGKLVGGLAPIGGSLLSSGIQYLFDSIAAKKQRKLANEQWQKENEYNSPAAMLARFKAAGIHPGYGSEHFNTSSASFSNAASVVATPQVPDVNSILAKYQDLKNTGIQERSLALEVENQRMMNEILSKTKDAKIDLSNLAPQKSNIDYQLGLIRSLNDSKMGKLKGMLMDQEYKQKEKTNPFDLLAKKVAAEMADFGLTNHDSTFLRVLARMKNGNDFSKSFLPYVIGDRFASFAGDLLKIAIPTGYIGKLWQATRPTSKILPNYNY